MKLQRNEDADYWVGSWLLNFIVAELIVTVCILLFLVAAWPDVPWRIVLYSTAAAATIGPLLTFPFSRALWLALDLSFRPPEPSDFERVGTNST